LNPKQKESFQLFSDGAVAFIIEKTDKEIGVIDAMQKSYLWSAGLRMVVFSFLMLVVSVMAAYLASGVAAGIGRDLRSKIYKNVIRIFKFSYCFS